MYLNKKKLFLIISLFSLSFIFIYSNIMSYNIKVIDGDTIYLNGEKIRFSGIDTPELKQTCNKDGKVIYCGIEAKNLLKNKIGDNKVNCIKNGSDIYKRVLAECFVNDLSLSRYLVREGYAFAYRKYSNKFVNDENFAKLNNYGMWSMKFEYPWNFRKK